ncbi:MAG TPA: molecular chaperone DnaJ, partial [Acetobacteraceae bacterium]|nr:molecular chaperone DnaJ [Acetobacteraceae bacterium]
MMTRRSARPRAYAPDPDAPGRCCDMPGCGGAGEYRAPKSRQSLREYWWFCLEHVRAYNAAWDFYKGMSPAQIEAEMRADTHWQRPTWPLGH